MRNTTSPIPSREPAVRRLGAFIASAPSDHAPLALERARTAFLDTIGCMLLGAGSEAARIVRAALSGWGEGAAVLAGTAESTVAPWAALANGTAAHAYDLDDYEDPGNTHPSAVLVPALLAVAADREVSAAALLDAYIVGLEVIIRLGEAVNFSHYNRGWHSTRTLGAIGAAAGVARLMQLEAGKAGHAVSLATSMTGGFTSQFGTTAKALHAGLAAQAGVMAATLAAAGASSGPAVLDGPVGLSSLMADPAEVSFASLDRLGKPWGIEQHGLSIKLHSSCGYTHRAIDGALRLRSGHGLRVRDISSVVVSLIPAHRAILPFDRARTPAEALFSVPHTVALALIRGAVTPEDFTPAAVMDEDVQALAGRVVVETRIPRRPALNMDVDDPDQIEVVLNDGRVLAAAVGAPRGTPFDPVGADEVLAKFHRCAAVSVSRGHAKEIADACRGLDSRSDVRELTALLSVR